MMLFEKITKCVTVSESQHLAKQLQNLHVGPVKNVYHDLTICYSACKSPKIVPKMCHVGQPRNLLQQDP